MSLVMFYNGYWFSSSFASSVIYIIISVFTVSGNVLVCVTFALDPYGQLHKPQNVFLVNLAVSDLIMGALTDTLLASTYWISPAEGLFFAHYVCAIISGASSLLNLTALSVIRYYAVREPVDYQAKITRHRVFVAIVFIWALSLHLALLPVFGWRSPSYQLYLYGVGFGIPCVIIFVAYYGFHGAIRQHTRTIRDMEMTDRNLPAGSNTDLSYHSRVKRVIERERHVTKTIVLILSLFVASWLPFLMVDIIMVQCVTCRDSPRLHLARDVTLSITYFSAGINPLLYTWRVIQFRRAVAKVLHLSS
ncbi:adenosine receptor A2a [Nematostella vectensis]|uniref:adenosine receptor A2a n=1 Tax=Nematostella vectensis TaxID=45351 RepID=UPI0020778CBF|nr:adenosine receptor A2a [Nematostella vectensis]